jgi:hypothetical protein
MGVADSPDVANLYGAKAENEVIPQQRLIVMYGRYIDDCWNIVQAETRAQALAIASKMVIPGCTIEWEVNEYSAQFLDVWVTFQEDGLAVRHRPFTKKFNHLERIPWISAHPIDVKRGTFMGELTRMATLCSHRPDYDNAVHDLRLLYCARGYPLKVVMSWIKSNASKSWENRLTSKSRDARDLWVLKTHFNPSWEFIDIHKVEKAVKETFAQAKTEWDFKVLKEWGGSPRSLAPSRDLLTHVGRDFDSPWIVGEDALTLGDLDDLSKDFNKRVMLVSRKKNRSLLDVLNKSRKAQLPEFDLEHYIEIYMNPAYFDPLGF